MDPILDDQIVRLYDIATGHRSWQFWLEQFCRARAFSGASLVLAPSSESAVEVARTGRLPDCNSPQGSTPTVALRCAGSAKQFRSDWALLAPHLQRVAALVAAASPALTSSADALRALADSVGAGVVVIAGGDQRVLHVNQTANRLIDRTQQLSISDQCLRVQGTLRTQIGQALQPAASGSDQHLLFNDPTGCYALLIRSMAQHSTQPAAGAQRKLLLLTESATGFGTDYLQNRYELTPKESRLAIALLQGRKLEALPTEFDVSLHTLRTQLKSVLRKTNSESQIHLLNRFATDPALLFVLAQRLSGDPE